MSMNRMIFFAYDSYRGGFYLQLGLEKPTLRQSLFDANERIWCPYGRTEPTLRRSLFNGLATAFLREDGLFEAVESFWDHGGLPLREIHGTCSYLTGTYDFSGDELRVGPILVRQTRERLAFWFSTSGELPRQHWKVMQDSDTAIVSYFSSRKARAGWPVPGLERHSEIEILAGIQFEFYRSAAEYPIRSIHFSNEDFK